MLQIDSLCIEFRQERARVAAVRDVSLALAPGECVGVVGESGSGKTQTFLAAMGLLGRNALVSGSIRFEGREMCIRDRLEKALASGLLTTSEQKDRATRLLNATKQRADADRNRRTAHPRWHDDRPRRGQLP